MSTRRARATRQPRLRPTILGAHYANVDRFTVRARNLRPGLQSKPAGLDEAPMRTFRLPRALAGETAAPLLLVAGTRLEALRLLPLLRALRAPGRGEGALLLDTGESGAAVRDALREHGLAADLRLPGARGTGAAALAMLRLALRVRPGMIVAGGASRSGLAAAIAARGAGICSALIASSADSAPRLRWRMLRSLCTWFYVGRETPPMELPRGRALQTGDPLFDLCREQADALGSAPEAAAARVVIASALNTSDGERLIATLLAKESDLRIDWIAAPALGDGDIHPRLRRLGPLPHWRALALLRRTRALVTDDAVLALEARWFGRLVYWIGAGVAPQGCIEVKLPQLAEALHHALDHTLSPRPLAEDGRAAPRLAAHLLDRVEQRAFAGLLTRVRPR
jgi:hypothetical protein